MEEMGRDLTWEEAYELAEKELFANADGPVSREMLLERAEELLFESEMEEEDEDETHYSDL